MFDALRKEKVEDYRHYSSCSWCQEIQIVPHNAATPPNQYDEHLEDVHHQAECDQERGDFAPSFEVPKGTHAQKQSKQGIRHQVNILAVRPANPTHRLGVKPVPL